MCKAFPRHGIQCLDLYVIVGPWGYGTGQGQGAGLAYKFHIRSLPITYLLQIYFMPGKGANYVSTRITKFQPNYGIYLLYHVTNLKLNFKN